MKIYSKKNCLISMLSLGCMTIIVLSLSILYLYNKNVNGSGLSANISNVDGKKERKVHTKPSETSEIAYKALLVADSESDTEYLENAIEIALIHNANYIMHLGDVSKLGVLEDLEKVKNTLEDSGLEYLVIPGDRDLWKSGGELENFDKVFGDSYKLENIEGINFLLIDNSSEYEGIDEVQWEFIEENIDKADFVLLHNPIYKSGTLLGYKVMGEKSEIIDAQRVELLELVRKSNAKAVFAGDQHIFSENFDSEDDELNHYVIGAINSARSLTPSFAILTIYENGDYYVEKMLVN